MIYSTLILIDDKDKTEEINTIGVLNNKYQIQFLNSEKIYSYNTSRVKCYKLIRKISPENYIIKFNIKQNAAIKYLLDYGSVYKIIYSDNKSKLHNPSEITIQNNRLLLPDVKNFFNYFKEIAMTVGIETEDKNLLVEQFNKITELSEETIAAKYLSENNSFTPIIKTHSLIYPFGINQSQKLAAENAFSLQVSVIQGPPGTGKTQTILTILANILCQDKNVAIISNNNSAVQNVIDKLQGKELSFIAAFLGSNKNKDEFIKNQQTQYPPLSEWELSEEEKTALLLEISKLTAEIDELYNAKNRLANIEQEILLITSEQFYFDEYYSTFSQNISFSLQNLTVKKIFALWLEFEKYANLGKKPNLIQKIIIFFKYNKEILKLFSFSPEQSIPFLQSKYYQTKLQELNEEKTKLTNLLETNDFTLKQTELTQKSLTYLKARLAAKYINNEKRPQFNSDHFKHSSETFIQEYPVILSTAYSIKNSLSPNFIYDYLIVDEASQVDLATGLLALTCAKHLIIVGDKEQLPNIITADKKKLIKEIEKKYKVPSAYCYSKHSLLSSITTLWQEIPSTLLREHYRCHPRIINFCNQKFYHDQLIIMTEDKGEKDVLAVQYTPLGNHARDKRNQRQIDILTHEILPEMEQCPYQSIGIISPYRNQVNCIACELKKYPFQKPYEVDTVHKFQGREQDAIIISTVDNAISEFTDDPKMLNVAVSRAVKSLTIIISNNEKNQYTNYGDLIRYIQFNGFSLKTSTIRSIFDLLYKEYAKEREEYLKKHKKISEYDSENLMFALIETILQKEEFSQYTCTPHVGLFTIFQDLSKLNEKEKNYVQNPCSHTDFLIIHKMDKLPVLAIEVDGTAYHKENSRQSQRDLIKNEIFKKYNIPLLRLRTDESNEQEKIERQLIQINTYCYPNQEE